MQHLQDQQHDEVQDMGPEETNGDNQKRMRVGDAHTSLKMMLGGGGGTSDIQSFSQVTVGQETRQSRSNSAANEHIRRGIPKLPKYETFASNRR